MEGLYCNVNVVVCTSCLFVEFALSLCLFFLLLVCGFGFSENGNVLGEDGVSN